MKICFVSENYDLGGIQKVTYDLGKEMNKDHIVYYYSLSKKKSFFGQKITVSKPSNICQKGRRYLLSKYLKKSNNEYNPAAIWNKNLIHLTKFINENQIELLILNGGYVTSLLPKLKEHVPYVKVISWQHSEAEKYMSVYYKNILGTYKRGLNLSDAVVCLTEKDKQIFGLYNDKTFVINNIVNMVDYHQRGQVDKAKIKEEKIIGFCSRYDINSKGIDILCEIVRKLPDNYKVHFAGSGSKKQVKELNQILIKCNIKHKVILLGALKEDRLLKFYENIDLFISTSRWEGFGLTIVEAMHFNIPIISFDNTGPSMILDNGKYGIVIEKYDTDKFYKSIIWLLENIDEYNKYSELSRLRAKEFTSEKVYFKWVKIMKELSDK